MRGRDAVTGPDDHHDGRDGARRRLRNAGVCDLPDLPAPDLGAGTHHSRLALEHVVADPADEAAWRELNDIYRGQAPQWSDWADNQRWYLASVAAGLRHARGVPWLVEVCCGTGQATRLLDRFAPLVVATDASTAMVSRAPLLPATRYLVADVRRLPMATGSVPMLVALNGVAHLAEFRRVLAPGGQLLWCSSFGPGTPLYLPPERVADLLGPDWSGITGRAGHGDWLLLTRDP